MKIALIKVGNVLETEGPNINLPVFKEIEDGHGRNTKSPLVKITGGTVTPGKNIRVNKV